MRGLLGFPAPGRTAQLRALLIVSATLGLTAALAAWLPAAAIAPSLGAAAVLVASLPNAPITRLWPLLGGTLLCGLIATLIVLLRLPLWLSVPLTMALALLTMYRLRCLHPPGGAMALWILLSADPHNQPWLPLLGCLPGLLLLAIIVLLRGGPRQRPNFATHRTHDADPTRRHAPGMTDWQYALDTHPEPLDVGAPQLQALFHEVESNRMRHQAHTLQVRDIMSRNLITLAPHDRAQRAWQTLQQHRIKTIPVIHANKVVGVISLVDLLKHLGLAWRTLPEDLNERAGIVLDQDVATLMSKPARTVPDSMGLDELVPLLSDWGLHHVPVVDDTGRLVGMVTQSDLIAGLAHLLGRQPAPPE
jgi:CBS domain-containing membrane protein